MSRFVPAGQSDLKTQASVEQDTSTQIREETEQAEIPSLYEQMRLNHERKEFEFRAKMQQKNSAFKVGEKDLQFYDQKRLAKEEKEKKDKEAIDQGLRRFEEERLKKQSTPAASFKPEQIRTPLISTTIKKPSTLGIKKKKKTSGKTKANESKLTQKINEQIEEENDKKKTSSIHINNYSSDSDSE
ncbi:hypothetical protein WICPIJ_002716 [Wickerhamomyces pijperi]|uniref:FAM192A/Fyv6 N-terminal domain-containing protein n=1 Tax=Wickerhamomyces pijperi TaxID=599730 RepID=A0A9P8QBD7_WICPI|nr:hypothetical protein WICPIJ_002716 [Wickerhamomyces pijperi]